MKSLTKHKGQDAKKPADTLLLQEKTWLALWTKLNKAGTNGTEQNYCNRRRCVTG